MEQAKQEMNKKLDDELVGIAVTERDFEVRDVDAEIFEVTVRAKCLEEIAKKVEIPA